MFWTFYDAISVVSLAKFLYVELFLLLIDSYVWSISRQMHRWCHKQVVTYMKQVDSMWLAQWLVLTLSALATFWHHLWSITKQMHGNMESIWYEEHEKKQNKFSQFVHGFALPRFVCKAKWFTFDACFFQRSCFQGGTLVSAQWEEEKNQNFFWLQSMLLRTWVLPLEYLHQLQVCAILAPQNFNEPGFSSLLYIDAIDSKCFSQL